MATEKREVELIIKGQNLSGKTFKEAAEAVDALSKSIAKQVDAAKKGEGSLSQLKSSYKELADASAALTAQDALVGRFQRASAELAKLKSNAEAARVAFDNLNAQQSEAGGKATGQLGKDITAATKAMESADRVFEKQKATVESLTASLAKLGIETTAIDKTQTAMVATARSAASGLTAASGAIDDFATHLTRAKDAQAQFASKDLFAGKAKDAAALSKIGESMRELETSIDHLKSKERDLVEQGTFARKAQDSQNLVKISQAIKTLEADYDKLKSQENELVSRAVFGNKVKDAANVLKVSDTLQAYDNALSRTKAAEKAFSDQTTFNKKAAEAKRLVDAANYANFWGKALDEAVVHERQFLQENGAYETKGQKVGALRTRAKELSETYKELNATQKEVAASTAKINSASSGGGENPFASSGRTTLSLMHRIRGEILALTAAYVGLQGAIQGVTGVIDVVNSEQQINSKLLVANSGDVKAAAEDYKFLRAMAQSLGIVFPDLAKQYGSFAVAARKANMTVEETRYVFQSVAKAGRALGMSRDDMQGVFLAITQMIGKGKIQAEELTQQLSERLPGAIQLFAAKYKGGMAQLQKDLKAGKVEAASGVLTLAKSLDENFAQGAEQMKNGVQAMQARFENAIYDFKKGIANSGLEKSFVDLLKKVTSILQSDDGAKFATALANGFDTVAKVLVFLLENLDSLIEVLKVLGTFYLAKQFMEMGFAAATAATNILSLSKAFDVAYAGATKMEKGMMLARAAFMLFSAAIVGWEIGTILSEKFESVRMAGIALVVGLDQLWIKMKYGAQIAAETIVYVWESALAALEKKFGVKIDSMMDRMKSALKAMPGIGGAVEAMEVVEKMQNAQQMPKKAVAHDDAAATSAKRLAELRGMAQKELQMSRDVGDDMFKYATDQARAAMKKVEEAAKQTKTAVGEVGVPKDRKFAGVGDDDGKNKALEKYKALLAEVEAIEARALKKQKEDIGSVTQGIELQFKALFDKLDASGVKGADALKARLRAAVDALKAEAEVKYQDDQNKRVEAVEKQIAQLETRAGKSKDATLDQRVKALDDSMAPLYKDIDALDVKRQSNLRQQVDLLREQLIEVERIKTAEQSLVAAQKPLNDAIAERDLRIRTVQLEIANGTIAELDGRQKIKEILEQSQPAIDAFATSAKAAVESLRGILSDTQLDAVRAKIDELDVSQGKWNKELNKTADDINNMIAGGVGTMFDDIASSMADAIDGTKSWGEALGDVRNAFLKFASDFLRNLAMMIIKQQLLNMLKGSGGGIGGAIAGALGMMHTGGVVGAGAGQMVRTGVPFGWFDNAPRYHSGGVAGLSPNEYPAILQKNEEVLTSGDPRNVLNGGGQAAPQIVPQDIKIVNTIDSGGFFSEGLSTSQGTKAIMNFVQANRAQFKNILGN